MRIYGYREEAVSTYNSIRRNGLTCTTAICMGTRCNPSTHPQRIPTESALAGEKGWPTPSGIEMFESRLFFYHRPKPLAQTIFRRQKLLLARTLKNRFLLRFPLAHLKEWNFYPDGALNPAEASYFVFPGIPAGKTVVSPRSIEVLGADLRWRSLFWSTLAARQMTGA
ncbi:MAG TPA: hypothetical protein VE641_13825 [Chthoniobacterales bacterium]|nr:hypothetical protein [Chthoniobacterales bacterium]